MNSLGKVFQEMKESQELHLYGELAPLYDFVYNQMYDYETQADKIRENAPAEAGSILELACGTGRLLEKLQREFENCVAVDTGSGCVEIAAERNPEAEIYQDDMGDFETERNFDAVAVMGFSLGALTPEELEEFVSTVVHALGDEGVLIMEHEEEESKDGGFTEETFEGEEFDVTVRSITVKEQEQDRFTMSYEVEDRETGEKRSAGEIHDWHHHRTERIMKLLEEKGFESRTAEADAEIYGSSTETIVAEKNKSKDTGGSI
jgi:SAM-dependent methyltransferase